MWDHCQLPLGLQPAVDCIMAGEAVYVTNGSYNRLQRSDLNGAGWLIYSNRLRQVILRGSMYEVSAEARSYRGELLGLLAIHTFILAVSLFYEVSTQHLGLFACDNKCALFKANVFRKRIPPGAKHGDILRCLCRTLYSLRSRLAYEHVYGHQDRLKSWSQLTLLEKLNCKCDTLAKTAVYFGAANSARATLQRQLLPHEPASVFHKGKKLSNDCDDEIRFQVYLRIARKCFVEELGWHGATFDDVDWDQRAACLRGKPVMYQ